MKGFVGSRIALSRLGRCENRVKGCPKKYSYTNKGLYFVVISKVKRKAIKNKRNKICSAVDISFVI